MIIIDLEVKTANIDVNVPSKKKKNCFVKQYLLKEKKTLGPLSSFSLLGHFELYPILVGISYIQNL